MCLSEPFFIYLCPALFDSTYLYFYFCLSPFLDLHYQISWIIKLCIGIYIFITSLPPHKWKRTWLSYHVSITFVLHVFCYYYRFKCKTHLSPPFSTKEGCILILFCGVGKSKLFISLPLRCIIKEKSWNHMKVILLTLISLHSQSKTCIISFS